MSASYVRCGHCRGFYELALSHCRYCGKDVPLREGGGVGGAARVFPDRETCRAIQIAEYEQLPKEAHEDCFRPDPELLDKKCYCLHCGPGRESFEAVEMRWMVNEQMWACPCTTCGGRGFSFDIHPAEPLWQCAECEHWYAPANGDRRASNAKCPKCGSTMANGWFDDEYEEGEGVEETIEEGIELPEDPAATASEQVEFVEFESGEDDEEEADDFWRPEAGPAGAAGGEEPGSDDIDYPREGIKREDKGEFTDKDDDIPW